MNYANLVNKLFWKKRSLPVYLIFFITNRCNASCNHCFYWEKINKKNSELNLEEIERLSKTIGPLYHINLTGGEPFLRDDLHEIVYAFYKNCKTESFGIPTNGYNADTIYEITNKIVKLCPDLRLQIDVSLDHLNGFHDRIRNSPGLFDNALRTIEALKKMDSKRLTVGVNLTFTKENESDIEKIYNFIKNVIQPHTISPLLIRGNPRYTKTKDFSSESYKKLISLWINDVKVHRLRSHNKPWFEELITARDILSRRIIISRIEGKAKYIRCLAGILGGVLCEDGEVFPCELLSESFGNIRDYNYNFKKVWFSPKAKKNLVKIEASRCSCTHECFQNLSVLFNIRMIPLLLKEWFMLKF